LQAFTNLFECILHDAEDIKVLLPYAEIRQHLRQYSHHLDLITTPSLLIMNIGDPDNIMVVRDEDGERDKEGERSGEGGAKRREGAGIRISGFVDWTRGIFGDPTLANVWDDDISPEFLSGWRGDLRQSSTTSGRIPISSLIEEPDQSSTGERERRLLYKCYQAVVALVTEYYRPRHDSRRRADNGRRKLTSVLRELERLET